MDYISCTGTEYSLTDCVTRSTSRQSDHSEDVGVQCQPGMVSVGIYNVAMDDVLTIETSKTCECS